MRECSICFKTKSKKEMSKYKITDVFFDPTCNTCVEEALGEDYNGVVHDEHVEEKQIKRISLKLFTDKEKKAYKKFYRKMHRRNNPQAFTRTQCQRSVYSGYREEIKDIYSRCKLMNKLYDETYEVDHIVPVKGKNVCGLHLPCNLQIITQSENRTKTNKFEDCHEVHFEYGGKQMTYGSKPLNMNEQEEVLEFIKQYNAIYTDQFREDMLSLFHKFMNDDLYVDDFESVCANRGVDIMADYSHRIAMMNLEDDNEDD